MVPSRRARNESTTLYRLALWAGVAIVGILAWLDNSPVHLEANSETATGEPTVRKAATDVVVLVDWRAIHNSETDAGKPAGFRTQDWSGAWVGLLEQEIGPVGVLTPASLTEKRLESARVLVLTASVSDAVPETLRTKLRRQALDGKLIVIERPEGALREAFSANGEAGRQIGRQITHVDGMADPYRSQLMNMPIDTEYIGSTSPRQGAETLLSLDGAPVIYAAPIGDGTVVTVDFDLGEQLVALQQGRPQENFRVQPSSGDSAALPRVDDLVMDPKMSGAAVPWADLLERFVVHGVIGRYAPLPAMWPYPNGALGAVVPLHCDDRLGDGGGWMLEYEAERESTSTILSSVDSGLTAAGAAVMHRRGGDVGLLWKRAGTPEAIDERLGVWGLEPLARPLSLGDQLKTLGETLPSDSVFTTKIAGRWWDRDWTEPFRQLAASGVAVDTSYEPTQSGYAFGTGLPTRILDTDGLPLGVRELPVVIPSGDTKGPELDALLAASRTGHHQVLTWSLSPTAFADYPAMERFDAWIGAFDKIERADHLMTSARRLVSFRRERRQSKLSSRLLRNVAPPEGQEGTPGDGDGLLLRISAEASDARMSLMVPTRVGGRPFDQARRRASRVQGKLVARKLQTERESIVGFPVRRIPLESGSSRIDVYYHSETGSEPEASPPR